MSAIHIPDFFRSQFCPTLMSCKKYFLKPDFTPLIFRPHIIISLYHIIILRPTMSPTYTLSIGPAAVLMVEEVALQGIFLTNDLVGSHRSFGRYC